MQPFHASLFRLCLLAVTLCCLNSCAEPRHEFLMLPMSDGTRLATDVYTPAHGDGPWPVILARSTYGRAFDQFTNLAKEGYAVVVQDVRGMGASEGEKYVFHADGWRPDQHDGADTAAWIHNQPWCNGKIGTMGGSALSMTQMLLAPATPHLAAQVIEAGPANFYTDAIYQGGVFRTCLIEGWLTLIGQPHLIQVYKDHPTYDEFWTWYNTIAQPEKITAPALFVNGWYDIFAQGTIDGFLAREQHGGPGAKGNNYLIMKWSPHGPDVTTEYTHNENRFDVKISRIRDAFFAYHLKGQKNALDNIPKVQYYVMGDDRDPKAPGNEWRSADHWPPYPTRETPFYLHDDGTLSTDPPRANTAKRSFTFDPKNPYPTLGGPTLMPGLPAGPWDQRRHSNARKDLLKFASAPLEAPLEITGRVKVRLYISSDAPDTDFTAKLLDIFPEGDEREINILDNIQRVKMRNGLEQAAPLLNSPDEIVQLEIDLWSTAWIFNTGHRIGLHISSSNHPRFEVNPNTGADHPTPDGEMRTAQNTVHCAAPHPSAILLPCRPAP